MLECGLAPYSSLSISIDDVEGRKKHWENASGPSVEKSLLSLDANALRALILRFVQCNP